MTARASFGRPTDTALWASVATTLRNAVLPVIDDPHIRKVVIQLIGLATYARDRGDEPSAERVAALAAVLDELAGAGDPIVAGRWSREHARDTGTVMAACADALAHAIDADEASRRNVRSQLRPLLVQQLDADLATEDVLLGAYRGGLPDE